MASVAEVLRHRPLRAPEIVLKLAVGRALYAMGPEQFFLYDLHNRPMRTWRDYRKFQSPFRAMMRAVNWATDPTLSADKVCTAARCGEQGIPDIPVLAIIGRDPAQAYGDRFPTLNSLDALRDYLLSADCPAELYVKPADGSCGEGQYALKRVGDGWEFKRGVVLPAELAAALLNEAPASGLVVQPRLYNHTEMAPIGGALGLATVRVVVANTVDGPEVLAAVQKIIGGHGHVDNFLEGKSGNLIANVDLATGRLDRVFGRMPGQRYLMSRIKTHPITGHSLTGFQLPLWRETTLLAGRVALAMPEQPLLGIDLAITDAGPLLVESNSTWNPALPQVATLRGIKQLVGPVLPRLNCADDVKQKAQALLAA